MALLSLFFAFPIALYAQLNVESGTIDVDLIVEGCNNNLVCESIIGEDTLTCPLDCPEPPPAPVATSTTDTGESPRRSNRRLLETKTGAVEEIRVGIGEGVVVTQFDVDARVVNALFTFSTDSYTIASVRIGKTSEYELRAVAEFGYRRTHELLVSGLQPSTSYEYEVLVADVRGNITRLRGVLVTQSTLSIPSVAKPLLAKPSDLKIRIVDGIANATWVNPLQQSVEYVHVVRTTEQPAQTPEDGITVYKGTANSFSDTGIVPDATYYYTFFSNHGDVLFSDGVFVPVRYSDVNDATEIFTTFSQRFGDETFGVFDFTFTQFEDSLVWEDRALVAVPFEPILVQFKKPNFFGPLEDVYVEVVAYNSLGEVTDRRFQKLAFKTELYAYQTILDGFNPDQTLLVTLNIIRADGTRGEVLAKINIGAYSSYETSVGGPQPHCVGNVSGFQRLTRVLTCTMPWPLILLVAFLASVMHCIRKMLIKKL